MARVMKQDSGLRERFQEKINKKIQADKKVAKGTLGNSLFSGEIADFVLDCALGNSFSFEKITDLALDFRQAKNQLEGNIGEFLVSSYASALSDDWVVFDDIIIEPTPGVLTQIDHVLIGKPGMYLVETKAWRGSFIGYRDKWKRRDGYNWVPCSSPTAQSAWHADAVKQWIVRSNFPVDPQEFVADVVVFTQAKWIRATKCSSIILGDVSILINHLHNASATRLTLEQVNQLAEMLANPSVLKSASCATPKPKVKVKPRQHNPEKVETYQQDGEIQVYSDRIEVYAFGYKEGFAGSLPKQGKRGIGKTGNGGYKWEYPLTALEALKATGLPIIFAIDVESLTST